MPQIIKSTELENAFCEINEMLEEIRCINAIVSGGDYSFRIRSVGGGKGRLALEGNNAKKLIPILKARKVGLVKKIRALAAKYRLEFTENEKREMRDAEASPA